MQTSSKLLCAALLFAGVMPLAWAQSVEKSLSLTFESEILVRQDTATITLADVVAFMDNRIPEADRLNLLSDLSRVSGVFNTLVQDEWAFAAAQAEGLLDDPVFAARVRNATLAAVRGLYRDQFLDNQQRESYTASAREMYLARPERFMGPERHDFEHILIMVGGERSETDAMRLAIAAHERLVEGIPFVEVAAEFSDDTAAAESQHRYEDANLAEVVPPLANAMREAGEGNFSVPVRSQFGWHIGRIVATHPPELLPWEDVQARAEERARRDHLVSVWERKIRQSQDQPAVFAEGAIRRLLNHYGLDGLPAISEAALIEEMEP